MSRPEFNLLADLLRETSIYLDSLLLDDAVGEALSDGQRVQAQRLIEHLDRLELAVRAFAVEEEEEHAVETAAIEPATEATGDPE